jgi:hypothetical protein
MKLHRFCLSSAYPFGWRAVPWMAFAKHRGSAVRQTVRATSAWQFEKASAGSPAESEPSSTAREMERNALTEASLAATIRAQYPLDGVGRNTGPAPCWVDRLRGRQAHESSRKLESGQTLQAWGVPVEPVSCRLQRPALGCGAGSGPAVSAPRASKFDGRTRSLTKYGIITD